MQPTPAQHAIKQSAVAGGITALATVAAGTYQYVLGHGLNIPALLLFLLPFITGQGLTLWHTLRNSPQFNQALTDTVLDLPQEIKELPGLVGMLHARVDALFANQHTHQVPTTAIGQAAPSIAAKDWTFTPPAKQPAPAPVPQQPFPGQSFAPNAPAQPLNWTGLEIPAAPK